jgi:hypothetical protein
VLCLYELNGCIENLKIRVELSPVIHMNKLEKKREIKGLLAIG